MTDFQLTQNTPQRDKELCDEKKQLEQLVEYLADLAAEEHLQQASEKRKP